VRTETCNARFDRFWPSSALPTGRLIREAAGTTPACRNHSPQPDLAETSAPWEKAGLRVSVQTIPAATMELAA
jgi:hypothetical protein